MINELKQKTVKKSLTGTIILIIIGAVLVVLTFNNFLSVIKGHVKFETLQPDEIKHQVVDVSLTTNFGAFIEEYEKNTKTGVTRTTKLYYIIWTGDDEDTESDYKFMGIKVPVSYEKQMEEMANASYEGMVSEPIEFSGAIEKMDDEEYGYFKEYLQSAGWTDEDIENEVIPYFINVGALVGGNAVGVYVMMGAGLLLLVIAICRLIFAITGGYVKKMYKSVEALGHTESEANWDYESAVAVPGTEVRIGRMFTFAIAGCKVVVVPNDKLIWTYFRRTTHRTNGVKTGTTYDIAFVTMDKKTKLVNVSSEKKAIDVLQYIGDRMPRVVIGYSDELNRIFNKEFDNFLKICYNNPEKQEFPVQDEASVTDEAYGASESADTGASRE